MKVLGVADQGTSTVPTTASPVVAKTRATSAVRTASEQLLHNVDPKVAPCNFGSTVIQEALLELGSTRRQKTVISFQLTSA